MNVNSNINQKVDSFIDNLLSYETAKLNDKRIVDELSTPSVIRAVIYLRVSTKLQAGKEMASLKEQKKQTLEFIERHGWICVGIYKDEGKSGTKTEGRDGYLKLKEDAKQGKFDVIAVWDFDRFGRDTGEMISARDELRKEGVQLTSVNCPVEIDDPRTLSLEMRMDKDLIITFQAMMAKEENRKRVLRMNLGKMNNARKGLIPGRVPYGYKKIVKYIGGQKTKKLQKVLIVKQQAQIVQKIFNLYDYKSWGIRLIAEHLNQKSIPASRGGKWEYTSVRYLLKNYTYTGLVRWGWYLALPKKARLRKANGGKGIIENGDHPQIITEKQFKRVKEKMHRRSKLGGRAVASSGLLVGIAKCGRCGGGTYVTKWPHWYAYTKKKSNRGKYTPTYTYLCSNYSRMGRSGCTSRYVMSQIKLEKKVIQQIKKLAENKDAQKAFIARLKKGNKNKIKKEVQFLKDTLVEQDKRLQRQKQAYEAGIKPLEEYAKDTEKNEGDKAEIEKTLEVKTIELNNETKFEQQSIKSLLALVNFNKVWSRAEFGEKKELLNSILDNVVVKKNHININFRNT